jgi:hypothetical protein
MTKAEKRAYEEQQIKLLIRQHRNAEAIAAFERYVTKHLPARKKKASTQPKKKPEK